MRRWILLAANLYPRAWRVRYGEEFQALLEDVSPGWRELADVIGGALKMQITRGTMHLRTIAALAVAGMVLAAAASFAVPRRYVSSAAVRIEAQPDATRIGDIETMLLSRSNLAYLIAGPLDLYSEERRRIPTENVIDQMKRDIRIRYVEAASPNGAPVLGISFAYSDKRKAQAVARELATEIVRQNAMINRSREENWRAMWPSEPPPPGQGLEILSIASLPQKPVSPNRFGFAACGLGAGLVLGLLTAMVMQWPKSSLRMAGFAIAGGALAFVLSWFLPETYTSATALLLVPAVVPERLVSDVSAGPAAEHLQRLAREVFSTASLAEIMRKPALKLYPEERARKPLEEVAGVMRRNIAFRPQSPPSAPPGPPRAFSISFSYPDPHKAQAVVSELVKRFVIRNILDERARIEATKNAEAREVADHGWGETLEVLDPASLPQRPVFPNRLAIAAAGLALGLLLGALAPLFRHRNKTPQPA
jgi:capsular polysaccharide biosynthesis protein